jgi:hypothetical protein
MNPLVKDFITKRRMPGAELLEETDDIETPYGSIARDSADIDPEAIGASPALSPEMVQSSNDSNLMSNMGRALSSLAAGGTKVADNSDLFTAMDAQTKQRDAMAGADLNRSAAVKKAIMASKAREAAQAQALGFKEKQLEESMRHHKAMEAASNASRAATVADRIERQAEREGKALDKKEEKNLRLAVPGYERTGEVLPKDEEAAKLRSAKANADQLIGKLTRLRELVYSDGPFEYGGKVGAEMASLATEIQLLAKNEDMYQLGVLTGPDLQMLQKITANPDSLDSLFTRKGTRLKQLDTQIGSVKDKLSTRAKSMGYREDAPKMVRVIDPNGIERMIPESDVQAALAAGGRYPDGRL